MTQQGYPRDMIGYGSALPDPKWPGGARVAVSFVINYEEGGENNILHGDAASEAYLSEIVGAMPLPGVRSIAMESMYEYGSRSGFWRLHRMFTERNMPLTVYGVTMALERNPAAVEAMVAADWEIASHGLRWIDYQDFSEADERDHIRQAVERHQGATGSRPLGWYTGRISPNTRRLVVEEGGFLYDSDSYADELPYWDHDHGKPHLIIPYALDTNDFRFAMPQGFTTGDQFLSYLKAAFDVLYEEGVKAPKMMSIGLHCRLSGRPGRASALAAFLDYLRGKEKVWVCRRMDIARHWHANFPPGPSDG